MSKMSALIAALLIGISASASASPALSVLQPYRGKPVYVDFWASWCVPCAQSFPWLNEMKRRYGDEIQFVGVNVDEQRRDADRFLQRHPAHFALLFDPAGALASHFALEGMPSALILDADGQVLWRHSGFRTAETPTYEQAIQEAIAR
jgi:cytochrome c biogenesis protein CcmG, thiol:disulfide interchange protein DsbE